jgi:HlyD family secretion protein
MIINAQVNQADVPRLKVGEAVEITIEAVPGLQATGVVERISPQATIKNNIKGYLPGSCSRMWTRACDQA